MTKKTNHDDFLLHDLHNKIFQAKSCLDAALEDQLDLKDNEWIQHSTGALHRAAELLKELAPSTNIPKTNTNSSTNKTRWNLQDYINQTVRSDIENLRQRYSLNIELRCDLLDEEKYVDLNDPFLKRIKENIIENALKAGSSKLSINYRMTPEYYTVSFSDDGCGMSTDELDRLLLKQYRKEDIHGLGTQFLLAAAAEHNFVLTYDSILGRGTTARFLCPYAIA